MRNKIDTINLLRKKIVYLLNKKVFDPPNFKRFNNFLKLYKELKSLAKDFYGTKVYYSFYGIMGKKHLKKISWQIAFLVNQKEQLIDEFSEDPNIDFKLNDLLNEYLKWIINVEKYILNKKLKELSDLELAEFILNFNNKDILKRTVGNTVSLVLVATLLKLFKKEKIRSPKNDDIDALCQNLKEKTKNRKLKNFLNKNFIYFKQAAKLRIKSVHLKENSPTKSEIETITKISRSLISNFKV